MSDMQKVKHGLYQHKLYFIWTDMKSRCYNSSRHNYHRYGGRGINICDKWKNNFLSFYTWSINNGWKEGLRIDRKDNNKGYNPENCQWITHKINCNNRNSNIYLEFNNKKQTLSQWTEELKFPIGLISKRLKRGWSIEKSLLTPKLR